MVYHNNLIHNTIQAYDSTMNRNLWDNGYPSGGNYWSDFDNSSEGAYDDYKGPNQDVLGSDGIVDNGTVGGGGKNPYLIDLDSQDNYPLIKPYERYLTLMQGWNLISTPFIQDNQTIPEVLYSINGSYDAVQWYDSSDPSDPWKHYKVGKSLGNDLSHLNESMGFWIHIVPPGTTLFHYNGSQPIANQTIQLHSGWNMVGYPSPTRHNRTNGLNNLIFGTDVDCIQGYDRVYDAWHFMDHNDYFIPGWGYWIHSKVEVTWEVPL